MSPVAPSRRFGGFSNTGFLTVFGVFSVFRSFFDSPQDRVLFVAGSYVAAVDDSLRPSVASREALGVLPGVLHDRSLGFLGSFRLVDLSGVSYGVSSSRSAPSFAVSDGGVCVVVPFGVSDVSLLPTVAGVAVEGRCVGL